jgi:hypothetical protein
MASKPFGIKLFSAIWLQHKRSPNRAADSESVFVLFQPPNLNIFCLFICDDFTRMTNSKNCI